jgi:ATP-dependent DNA ligase
VNRGQELVIGGYVPGAHGLDSIVVGYCEGDGLIYVARVRNGFVPASRRQLFEKLVLSLYQTVRSLIFLRYARRVGVKD